MPLRRDPTISSDTCPLCRNRLHRSDSAARPVAPIADNFAGQAASRTRKTACRCDERSRGAWGGSGGYPEPQISPKSTVTGNAILAHFGALQSRTDGDPVRGQLDAVVVDCGRTVSGDGIPGYDACGPDSGSDGVFMIIHPHP